MDTGDLVTLLNTGWTLYQIFKEWREKSTNEKAPKPERKRRKRKRKGKRRK